MALPILNTPEFEVTIPSTKQTIFFRPFLVKEEKLLFMALQGGETKEIHNAVKNVLTACIKTEDVDIDSLAMFDIEYLFLKLRGKSVGENVELSLRHKDNSECNFVQEYALNLDDVEVKFPDDHTNKIMITDDVGIKFNYPSLQMLDKLKDFKADDMQNILELVADNIDCVFDSESVFDQFTQQEMIDFLESLNQSQFKKVSDFFNAMPKLSHTIKWKCPSCGKEEQVLLEGLDAFFT